MLSMLADPASLRVDHDGPEIIAKDYPVDAVQPVRAVLRKGRQELDQRRLAFSHDHGIGAVVQAT